MTEAQWVKFQRYYNKYNIRPCYNCCEKIDFSRAEGYIQYGSSKSGEHVGYLFCKDCKPIAEDYVEEDTQRRIQSSHAQNPTPNPEL